MERLRRVFQRERVLKALKELGNLRVRISHTDLITVSILSLTLAIAFLVRLLPLRWGCYLQEFDPWYQYRLTKRMVEKGLFSWIGWHDTMSWYPQGRDIARSSFPGLALTAAVSYIILKALGLPMTLYQYCVIFPVIMGTLTCLVMYFLGKDIGGRGVGLISAFLLALNSSYIGRTSLGFFDDETVGIFGILLFFLFFMRSIEDERPIKSTLTYAVATGLSLGYLFASWGASRYPAGIMLVFTLALILLRKYSLRLLLSYSISLGIATLIAVNVPYLGVSFLFEPLILAAFGVFLILLMYEILLGLKTLRAKVAFLSAAVASIILLIGALSWLGYLTPLEAKYLSVLFPSRRPPLVESVQEHRPAAWGSFYYDLGIGAFFIPVGIFFAAQNPTKRNIFTCLFALTSIYFACSMVRLTVLMSPASSLLWALALVGLLRPCITLLREARIMAKRKLRGVAHVGKEFGGAIILLIFLLLVFTFVLPVTRITPFPRVLDMAYSPTTIASASVPIKPEEVVTDWIDALLWMKENLPPSPPTVVASWWDYGYWITIIANRTSLADNATLNSTQIRQIALMFLSNETEALKILRKYDVTHVVVFVVFDTKAQDVGYGDEGKWRWMARIAGLNETKYWDSEKKDWTDLGKETVIYKLMAYGKDVRLDRYPTVELKHFKLVYHSRGPPIRGLYYALVCVYEVQY